VTRLDDVRAIAEEINKKHGSGTVVLASDANDLVPRIPSGSLGLDLILGGGWPANQWVEIIGDPSSGKTALALKTIAANQALDPDWIAVWIAAEKWVSQYAEMCGVDLSRVFVVETNIMEDAYDHAIRFANSKEIDCIVIDSLPALVPTSENEKDMEGSTVGRSALLTGKFFRKVGKATKRSLIEEERPVLGIVINQWRMKIGVMYGDPRTSPGGVGKDYAYFVKLDVRRDEWIEVGTGADKKRAGQGMKIRTTKNKTAPAQQVAYLDFYFTDGGPVPPGAYDTVKEVISLAVLEHVVERRGPYYRFGENQWRGMEVMHEAIADDETLYKELAEEVKGIADARALVK
jgi:recombination protein RecA